MKKSTFASLVFLIVVVFHSYSQTASSSCYVFFSKNIVACDVYSSSTGKSFTTTGVYFDTVSASAGCDTVWIIRAKINKSKDTVFTLARCDSFVTSTGKILSSTGIYSDTLATSTGCDSIVYYAFTKGVHLQPVSQQTACDSFTSPTGKTWTSSGNYSDTINSISGCDTILRYNLTIHPTLFDTLHIFQCYQYYTISGKRILTSGTYHDTLVSSSLCTRYVTYHVQIGTAFKQLPLRVYCDSLVTRSGKVIRSSGRYLDTISYPISCDTIYEYQVKINAFRDTIVSQQCDQFIAPSGKVFLTSGVFADTVPGAFCDSVYYQLNLTIGQTTKDTISVFGCDTVFSPVSTNFWTRNGIYFDTTFTSQLGCDSSLYIRVSIGKQRKTASVVSCWNYVLPSGSKTITTSGIYLDTLTTSLGCDSLVELTIEINKADTTVYKRPGELIAFISGANYQWLDCAAGFSPVLGATTQTFLPTTLGTYALEVSKFGCVDTSSCYIIDSYAGLSEFTQTSIKVYPNPAEEFIEVDWKEASGPVELAIFTLKGTLIEERSYENSKKIRVQIGGLKPGIYTLKLVENGKTQFAKFIKK